MKKCMIFPLIIASLSMSLEMIDSSTEAETIVHQPASTEQENELTIYKDPKFISKWNSQFVEEQKEEVKE